MEPLADNQLGIKDMSVIAKMVGMQVEADLETWNQVL
jgi:hypothetical protein